MLTRPKLGIATWIFGKRPLSQTLADIAELDKVDGVELAVDIEQEIRQHKSNRCLSSMIWLSLGSHPKMWI